MYHFRDAVKHSARLVQCVFVVFCLSHYDVDTPLTRPGDRKQEDMNEPTVHPFWSDSQSVDGFLFLSCNSSTKAFNNLVEHLECLSPSAWHPNLLHISVSLLHTSGQDWRGKAK